jgi:hypothetical protein
MPARPCAQVNARSLPPLTWSRTFPAAASQVPKARHALATFLEGFPAASDALVCTSELVSNAILHTRSSRPGGHFTIRASLTRSHLRVEVQDDGGPWHPQRHHDGLHGWGLVIVVALARWGVTGDGTCPRTVWFEIGHP